MSAAIETSDEIARRYGAWEAEKRAEIAAWHRRARATVFCGQPPAALSLPGGPVTRRHARQDREGPVTPAPQPAGDQEADAAQHAAEARLARWSKPAEPPTTVLPAITEEHQ